MMETKQNNQNPNKRTNTLIYRSQIIHTGCVYDKATCLHSVLVNGSVYTIIDALQQEDILPQIQCFEPLNKCRSRCPSEFIFTVSDEWLEKFCEVLTEYSGHKYVYNYHPENSYILRTDVEEQTDDEEQYELVLSIENMFIDELPRVIAHKATH